MGLPRRPKARHELGRLITYQVVEAHFARILLAFLVDSRIKGNTRVTGSQNCGVFCAPPNTPLALSRRSTHQLLLITEQAIALAPRPRQRRTVRLPDSSMCMHDWLAFMLGPSA